LLPDGARKLREYRDKDDTDEINITGMYRDGVVGEAFAMHSIENRQRSIFKAVISLL